MKKKFMTVDFKFTTGENEYRISRLISIRYDAASNPTEHDFTEASYHVAKGWFSKEFPESECLSIIVDGLIEGNLSEVKVSRELRDHYDSEALSLSQIEQLIEETKPYTDFVVLKGNVCGDYIEKLEGVYGHYCNTMQDSETKDEYTVIKFKR